MKLSFREIRRTDLGNRGIHSGLSGPKINIVVVGGDFSYPFLFDAARFIHRGDRDFSAGIHNFRGSPVHKQEEESALFFKKSGYLVGG